MAEYEVTGVRWQMGEGLTMEQRTQKAKEFLRTLKVGTPMILAAEPDNPHDRDAIRVESRGETVGYVANSKYTLIKEVKSATDIKNTVSAHAEVQFILFDEWVIAKLI